MFNKKIDGFENEREFAKYLNGRKINELNPIFEDLVAILYGEIDKNFIISAIVSEENKKYDLVINIDKKIKRISIKKGVKNSVHVEGISSFIHFLIVNGVKREAIVEYLKYHYADGTRNGTGKERMSAAEYKELNQDKIDMLNEEINKLSLIEKAVDRFVLKGMYYQNKPIDAIIYGVVDDFIWITSEDIKKIIISKIDTYSTAVHFGPLTCQPMDRCLNKNKRYESKRFCVQIKWYNISDDIIENMNDNYCNNFRI